MIPFLSLLAADQSEPVDTKFVRLPPVKEAVRVKQAQVDAGKAPAMAKVFWNAHNRSAVISNGVAEYEIGLEPFGQPRRFWTDSGGDVVPPSLAVTINGESVRFGVESPGWAPVRANPLLFVKPFEAKDLVGRPFVWSPPGMGVKLMWANRADPNILVEVVTQMVDREPLVNQKITIRNGSQSPVVIGRIGDGMSPWPPGYASTDQLDLIIRPGATYELPEAWFTVSGGNLSSQLRAQGQRVLIPWKETVMRVGSTAEELKALVSQKAHIALLSSSVKVDWSDPSAHRNPAVMDFVKLAAASRIAPGVQVELSTLLGGAEDRAKTGAVCWGSFAGVHWRQNALLAWKRAGLKGIELVGELPAACEGIGHGHQTANQARLLNRQLLESFMRNALSLGIIVRHAEFEAYGPERWAHSKS